MSGSDASGPVGAAMDARRREDALFAHYDQFRRTEISVKAHRPGAKDAGRGIFQTHRPAESGALRAILDKNPPECHVGAVFASIGDRFEFDVGRPLCFDFDEMNFFKLDGIDPDLRRRVMGVASHFAGRLLSGFFPSNAIYMQFSGNKGVHVVVGKSMPFPRASRAGICELFPQKRGSAHFWLKRLGRLKQLLDLDLAVRKVEELVVSGEGLNFFVNTDEGLANRHDFVSYVLDEKNTAAFCRGNSGAGGKLFFKALKQTLNTREERELLGAACFALLSFKLDVNVTTDAKHMLRAPLSRGKTGEFRATPFRWTDVVDGLPPPDRCEAEPSDESMLVLAEFPSHYGPVCPHRQALFDFMKPCLATKPSRPAVAQQASSLGASSARPRGSAPPEGAATQPCNMRISRERLVGWHAVLTKWASDLDKLAPGISPADNALVEKLLSRCAADPSKGKTLEQARIARVTHEIGKLDDLMKLDTGDDGVVVLDGQRWRDGGREKVYHPQLGKQAAFSGLSGVTRNTIAADGTFEIDAQACHFAVLWSAAVSKHKDEARSLFWSLDKVANDKNEARKQAAEEEGCSLQKAKVILAAALNVTASSSKSGLVRHLVESRAGLVDCMHEFAPCAGVDLTDPKKAGISELSLLMQTAEGWVIGKLSDSLNASGYHVGCVCADGVYAYPVSDGSAPIDVAVAGAQSKLAMEGVCMKFSVERVGGSMD